ncbi:hypothetical protein [Neolewinella persica]|uniref:hypothetical protein n=1 Tax=Neolewinella persica TaxID=70998 RepID=UPI00037BDE65|nr:hypothetical protein [Neolewinella persica]
MTKYFSALFLFLALSLPTFAQEMTKKASDRGNDVQEVTAEDYEQIMESKMFINTRARAINSLDLTEQQTIDFTPILMNYTMRKEQLEERRTKLVQAYADEMAEDDTAKDEMNETGDFVENYWEIDIAEMELKKDVFDRLEDVITPGKAIRFFSEEDMYTRRAKRDLVVKMLPTMTYLVPLSLSYQYELDDYSNWNRINIDGEVGLNHEFTYNGLSKLLNLAEAMTRAEEVSVKNFSERKAEVMKMSKMMKKDWTSLQHADHARKAFIATSNILNDIAIDVNFDDPTAWLSKLMTTAEMIDPNQKLTDQASTIYTYFNTAEAIVNELVKQVDSK